MEKPNSTLNYYTIDEVYNIVYNRQISKSTIHKLCRNGTIPSTLQVVREFIVPAWWVEEQLAQAHTQEVEEKNPSSKSAMEDGYLL